MATQTTYSSRFARVSNTERPSNSTCPECSGQLLTVNRETCCRTCGLIVDEELLDHSAEWFVSGENADRRRTGAPLTAGRHDRGLSSEIGWHVDGQGNTLSGRKQRQLNRLRNHHRRSQWRSKREQNLAYGLGEVRRLMSALELSTSLVEQACTLFRRAQSRDLCRGRSLDSIAAASVYAVCRCNGLGRTLGEIQCVATCSRAQIERAYAVMNVTLELPTVVPRPQNVLPRLSNELELPDEVRYRALRLATIADNARLTVGRQPQGFAAACVYEAGKELGYPITQRKLADVANTSTATIRTHRNVLLEALDVQKSN
ncbi:transcription initiation factor IIB [Natronosalvus caseinilyticus]|uniref:transcription initiation factor IIB n=1 Tax=Natronosalvus caseinilyticus TaxID=2953747 RepID=UPI0028AE658A|nr:transcription initiation factor IIB family protein [Natronosalvus caseinilyticus]